MCGITGWVSFDRDLRSEHQVIEAMVGTMTPRGPDAGGRWLDAHAAIGHRRLAVIDIVGGQQPMVAEAAGAEVVLTYSGEVYNFVELREELRRLGHPFHTQSDTEVVLRAYLEWGEEMVHRLNGMYAFAVWDQRRQSLILVRDRLGIKPLYYSQAAGGVLFGSEPKAILAHPEVEPRVDLDGIREAYSLLFNTGPSVWSGIREVLPGSVVRFDRSGLTERTYWRIEARPHTDDLPTTLENVRHLLVDSAHRQLEADVPRCTLLSGGLDSTVLTALLNREIQHREGPGERIRSFAVDYHDQQEQFTADVLRSSPDAPFAREAGEFIGSDHHTILLDPDRLLDPANRQAVVIARDSPIGVGDMDTSLYLLFREIRRTSTVALSGEAADEVFGGYPWFHSPQAIAADTFPWLLVTNDRQAMPLHPDLSAKLRLREFQADTYRDALAAVPVHDGESPEERRVRELLHLSLTRWLRQLLHRKDRLSMAVGLEVRVPYCDHRLVEYVFNAPWAMKTYDGREKSLLRSVAQGLVPQSVLDRLKNHYPSTHDIRYNRGVQQQATEALKDPHSVLREIVDVDGVRPALEVPPERLGWGHRLRLERVIDLSLWLGYYNPTLTL
ncbi:asparagine synthase (glutamine-hydrolyzing) [Micromonospora sp. NPDC050187]|uniref:asparagine synthase (glutamine-hydrolyzing) n=1 Tax=Micromonospora sp. NPDC050187 TaxID=3364277 RepID=UPI0037B04FE5